MRVMSSARWASVMVMVLVVPEVASRLRLAAGPRVVSRVPRGMDVLYLLLYTEQ